MVCKFIVAFFLSIVLCACSSTDFEYLFGRDSVERNIEYPQLISNSGDILFKYRDTLQVLDRESGQTRQIADGFDREGFFEYGFDFDTINNRVVYLNLNQKTKQIELIQYSLDTKERKVVFSSENRLSRKSSVSAQGLMFFTTPTKSTNISEWTFGSTRLFSLDLGTDIVREIRVPQATDIGNLVLMEKESRLYFYLRGVSEIDTGLYSVEFGSPDIRKSPGQSDFSFIKFDEESLLCFDQRRPFSNSSSGMFLLHLDPERREPLKLPENVDERARGEIFSTSISPDKSRLVFYSSRYQGQDYTIEYLFEFELKSMLLREIKVAGKERLKP